MIVDVREPGEYAEYHVKGAINIPLTSLTGRAAELNDIPKDANIIVYCRTGSRSHVAKNILHEMGYDSITDGINKAQVEANYNL